MESSDQVNGSESLNDIMYRRLKNRERQRRYRQRKRLQADGSESYVSKQTSQLLALPAPMETKRTAEQVVTRVHCARDWKKDARRVQSVKQETLCGQSSAGFNGETPSSNCSGFDNHGKTRLKVGKRDWKAEARNKNRAISVTKSVPLHSGQTF